MARIAIFLDHDITIRHFVLNGTLPALGATHDLVFVFPHEHKRVSLDPARLGLGRYRTVAVNDDRVRLYRILYHASVVRRFRGKRDTAVRKFWHGALGHREYAKSWMRSRPGIYGLYRAHMLARIGPNEPLDRLLDEIRPDLILHPSVLDGLFVSDLIRAGGAWSLPTVFIMNSWDNAAAKAMMVGHPDHLVVWGEQTRQHAIERGAPPARVVTLGAAQFDVYRRPPKQPPAEYRTALGVAPDERILLYAGSSKGLNEIRHLVALDEAVEAGALGRTVVLYRPHPWRAAGAGEPDFFECKWRHVILDPSMERSYRASRGTYRASRERPGLNVELADYEDTHVTLAAVDAVISPLSTILLEAALHGKPIAAYLPDEDMARNKFLYTAANMAHFADFFERVECVRCERPDRLVDDCRDLLERAAEPGVAERLRKQCEYFVEPSDRPYTERLDAFLRTVLTGRGSAAATRRA